MLMLLLAATSVSAQEKSADQWQYDFQVYLWGATIKTSTVTGDSVLLNFGDIISNLDLAVMTTMGARKDKFSMLADVIYLDIGDSQRHQGEFLGQPVSGRLDVGLKSWVLNLIGGYNLIDSGKNIFDIAAGARYLNVDIEAKFKLNDNKRRVSGSDSVWDGVIGFKGRHNYPDGYSFNYYADVGGGDSKLTWQLASNFSYDYKKFTGIVGYRYLKWNLGNASEAIDDMVIHGPYVSAKFSF
ncbi:MAG: hypothetical protein WBS20_02145 [Lysobacterales bacterium]